MEPAPPVFSPLKCILFYLCESSLNAESSVSTFCLYSWECNHRRRLLDRSCLESSIENELCIICVILLISLELQCQTWHIWKRCRIEWCVLLLQCKIYSVTGILQLTSEECRFKGFKLSFYTTNFCLPTAVFTELSLIRFWDVWLWDSPRGPDVVEWNLSFKQ